MSLSEIKKTLITALGLIVSIGTLLLGTFTNLIPANIAAIISTIVGIATVALNYLAPNTTTDPTRVAGRSVTLKGKHEA